MRVKGITHPCGTLFISTALKNLNDHLSGDEFRAAMMENNLMNSLLIHWCILNKKLNNVSLFTRSSPVPVQPSVVVPVKKVRLSPQSAHIWMDPDELQHGSGSSLLHADQQCVRQLLVPRSLRNARVSRAHLVPVRSRRRGSSLTSRPADIAVPQLPQKFLASCAPARRAAFPLVAQLAGHDRAAAEEDVVAQVGAGQRQGEDEGEPGADSVRRREEPLCHVSMGSKRRMVFHQSPVRVRARCLRSILKTTPNRSRIRFPQLRTAGRGAERKLESEEIGSVLQRSSSCALGGDSSELMRGVKRASLEASPLCSAWSAGEGRKGPAALRAPGSLSRARLRGALRAHPTSSSHDGLMKLYAVSPAVINILYTL